MISYDERKVIAERLNGLLENASLEIADVAEEIGMGEYTCRQYFQGYGYTEDEAEKIEEFLKTYIGRVQVLVNSESESSQSLPKIWETGSHHVRTVNKKDLPKDIRDGSITAFLDEPKEIMSVDVIEPVKVKDKDIPSNRPWAYWKGDYFDELMSKFHNHEDLLPEEKAWMKSHLKRVKMMLE